MKQLLRYTLALLLVLTLVMAYLNTKEQLKVQSSKTKEWKERAEQLAEIPDYNEKAESFVLELNGGDGKDFESLLTGEALDEYNNALKDNGESIKDAYIDKSLIKTNVLLRETSFDSNEYVSKVMYEIDMSTVADNPDAGVIDKRIVNYIMQISWEGEKVKDYSITWFNDTLGTSWEGANE